MKKRLWIYPILGCIAGIVMLAVWHHPKKMSLNINNSLWISQRPLPSQLALDAYLSGNIARTNQNLPKAISSYLKVLEKDPQNTTLLEDTYLLAMIQGTPEKMSPYFSHLKNKKVFADYAQSMVYFQKDDLTAAFKTLNSKTPHTIDNQLLPLISAWLYAKQDNKTMALKQIQLLKDMPFVKGYQMVLLGVYFKDEPLIQKGITQMGDNDIPAIGFFPLIQSSITKSGNWPTSALAKKYQHLHTTYPVTADLLVQVGQTNLTPETALAEAFYLISSLGGNGKLTREEALILNSLSLLLQPDKQMALVWGAELAETLNLPHVALDYYQRLSFHSATLGFKEAAVLMLLNKTDEALPKLEQLEKTNKTSIPLLTLLGQAYLDQHKTQQALAIYNRLIPLLESNPKNDPLIRAYMVRSSLYSEKDKDKMLADLKRAQKLDSENPMLLNDLGYHQLENDEIEEGFSLVEQAYQKKPHDPYILDSMAFGYWKKGQPQVALPLAERALDLLPHSALINAHLGDIYASLGRKREASFQYKKALDLKTDLTDSLAQELNQKLNKETL